jgi:hypothetical protein
MSIYASIFAKDQRDGSLFAEGLALSGTQSKYQVEGSFISHIVIC